MEKWFDLKFDAINKRVVIAQVTLNGKEKWELSIWHREMIDVTNIYMLHLTANFNVTAHNRTQRDTIRAAITAVITVEKSYIV